MIEIILPWPSADLSPNTHKHWRGKDAARKAAREEGYFIARSYPPVKFPAGGLSITWEFYPPDRVRRDYDNLLARQKPAQDGIFQALGIDDSRIKRATIIMQKPIKGGLVKVRIETI